jgi:hypothetical protein
VVLHLRESVSFTPAGQQADNPTIHGVPVYRGEVAAMLLIHLIITPDDSD